MIKSKCYPRRCIKGLHHSEFKTQNFIDNVCGNCEIPTLKFDNSKIELDDYHLCREALDFLIRWKKKFVK